MSSARTYVRAILSLGIACQLPILASCSKSATPPPEPAGAPASSSSAHSDEPEHEELPKQVHLTPDVIRDAGVRTAPVTREVLAPTLALPGEVGPDPDRTAKVSSAVPGPLEAVTFKEGALVHKGDVLATVRVPDLGKLRGSLASTSAKAKAARANADRLKDLYESKLATQQAYLDAKAEVEALEADARSLEVQLASIGAGTSAGFLLSLRAPIAGTVVARNAVVGQPVGTDWVLATITDLSEVWFLARVFEKDLGALHEGASCEIELNAYPSERFAGTLEYIGQQIDPVARTVIARVRVPNAKGRLRLGLFGTAHVAIPGETKQAPTLVVPRSALIEVAGRTVVFVQHKDGDFELHEVTLGGAAPGKVAIVAGLREGEQVVVEGAFTLKSAVLKSALADED
jgi:cobalt-zinc-cadmium efflux system membrane fusion protein